MKIYYSKFAYTVMLVCSIIMLIALSIALYVLMFNIPKIETLPKILLGLLLLFAFIFSVGFTVMTIYSKYSYRIYGCGYNYLLRCN